MDFLISVYLLLLNQICLTFQYMPLFINTWQMDAATRAGWHAIELEKNRLDALVSGGNACELWIKTRTCDSSVGWGGSPDERGETTLDAMIMDGKSHDVGSVGGLRGIKNAIGVAKAVMDYTEHTLLVGNLATDFAVEMGFQKSNLTSEDSAHSYHQWKANNCQPNYRKNVNPNPMTSCGPYTPINNASSDTSVLRFKASETSLVKVLKKKGFHHDTIAMVAIDKSGHLAAGTTTNGDNHKIPGRVGDSPIAGAGAWVDDQVGGAGATGDGDIMMRFLPSLRAVDNLRAGMSPGNATRAIIDHMLKFYPKFNGAMFAVTKEGQHGGACTGFEWFKYNIASQETGGKVKTISVDCY